jgi:hypothetical protein
MEEYNHERPHQAIGMKYPDELYVTSSGPYQGRASSDGPVMILTYGELSLRR